MNDMPINLRFFLRLIFAMVPAISYAASPFELIIAFLIACSF